MDPLTVSIAIGLIVSLLFTEYFGLSTGGMIVPGYLALQLNQPVRVVVTLLTAVCAWAAVRLISRYAIVYGRRRIVRVLGLGKRRPGCGLAPDSGHLARQPPRPDAAEKNRSQGRS